MSMRNWITQVEDASDYVALRAQIRHNPLANPVAFVLDITKECPFGHGICVIWGGDGRSSLEEFMSPHFCEATLLLDNFLDEDDHDPDLTKYGRFLDEESDVLAAFTEREAIGDGEILLKLVEEGHFARNWSAGLHKDAKCRKYHRDERKFERELLKELEALEQG